MQGEKNIYPPGFGTRSDWLGRLMLNGVYRIAEGEIQGSFNTEFTEGDLKTDTKINAPAE